MENAIGRHPDVAVAVVAYRSDAVLPAFLESVRADSPSVAIIVADNDPTTGHAQSSAVAAGARYLALDNRGYGHAINAAVAELESEAEWVLICNPDLLLRAGSIDALRATGASSASIASVGPRIVDEAGAVYPSARSVPSLRNGIGHALFSRVWPNNPWSRSYRNDDASSAAEPIRRDAGWLSGACLMVRRSAFEQIGGFDDAFFMYFEDVDLGYRFSKAGYRNVFEPTAVVMHIGAHSTGDSAAMLRAHHRSAERFINNKYSAPVFFPLRMLLRLGLRARAAILSRRR